MGRRRRTGLALDAGFRLRRRDLVAVRGFRRRARGGLAVRRLLRLALWVRFLVAVCFRRLRMVRRG